MLINKLIKNVHRNLMMLLIFRECYLMEEFGVFMLRWWISV